MFRWVIAALSLAVPAMADAPYSERLMAKMPAGMVMAPEVVTVLDWLEGRGYRQIFKYEGGFETEFIGLYPPSDMDGEGVSFTHFNWQADTFTGWWDTPNPQYDDRVFTFVTTSGDGGRAGIWLDETGKQWFVHMGHDVAGIISDDPLVFLTFLTMGYVEPGSLEVTDVTPLQELYGYWGVATDAEFNAMQQEYRDQGIASIPLKPIPSVAVQNYLSDQFDVTYPATARDLGIADFAYYGGEDTQDLFMTWIDAVTPEMAEDEVDPADEAAAARFVELLTTDKELNELMNNPSDDPEWVAAYTARIQAITEMAEEAAEK